MSAADDRDGNFGRFIRPPVLEARFLLLLLTGHLPFPHLRSFTQPMLRVRLRQVQQRPRVASARTTRPSPAATISSVRWRCDRSQSVSFVV